MSQDQQSESKAWWQTLPGILTATAAILTAFTGLLVALNQIGVFHRTHAPAAAQNGASVTPVAASDSGSQATANPAAGSPGTSLALPANAELRTQEAIYTLLAARVSPYAPGQVALDCTVRMSNLSAYDANFWASSFRLSVNGVLETPSNDLDEIVPGSSAKEAEVEFVIPANASTVGLQMGDVGEGKPALALHLSNP